MSEETQEQIEVRQTDRFLAIAIPERGFSVEQLEPYIRMGYRLWGIVPLSSMQADTPGLIVPPRPVPHLLLDREVPAVPINLLAHHIVKAKETKTGLEHLCRALFGMSLGQLIKTREEAERRFNEQR